MTLVRAALEMSGEGGEASAAAAAAPLPPAVTTASLAGVPLNASPAGGGAPPLADAGWNPAARRPRGRLPPPFPPGLPLPSAPAAALAAAHARVRLPGSCTALVALLDPATSTLHGINLGDSGLLVLRAGGGGGGGGGSGGGGGGGPWTPVFRTAPQQHFFDCPFQLASGQDTDGVGDGAPFQVPLRRGDVLVAASDGLWDNAWAEEVAAALPGGGAVDDDGAWPATAAARLVGLAAANAGDPTYPGPYAAEATAAGVGAGKKKEEEEEREGGGLFGGLMRAVTGGAAEEGAAAGPAEPVCGGKQDDITVVVGVVV